MDHNPSPSLQAAPPASDKRGRAPPYHAALHSVQKPPGKPWKRPDPSPPKVYRVDPRGFRQLVQRLTGANRSMPRGTPPPLKLAAPARSMSVLAPPPPPFAQPVIGGGDDHWQSAAAGSQSPTGFELGLLSPSFFSSWCSFPLLSPAGAIGSMEHI